jgi:hypothetical protein
MRKAGGTGIRILRAILERLREDRLWRVSTEQRQLSALAEAIEEERPGLLPSYPIARQAYLRKAMEVF